MKKLILFKTFLFLSCYFVSFIFSSSFAQNETKFIPYKVIVKGILIKENKTPVVNAKLWIGGYPKEGGFEVTIDDKEKALNPSGISDFKGRFNIVVQSKFVSDKSVFTICTTGSLEINAYPFTTDILEKNNGPITFIIDGKKAIIYLGEIIYNEK
jgi:hypothetical protein